MVWGSGLPWGTGAPWLGSGPTVAIPGSAIPNVDRTIIEIPTFLVEQLNLAGTWDSTLTGGRKPLFVREEYLKRVNFTEKDVITVRQDNAPYEPADVGYDHWHRTFNLVFRCWTRFGEMHAKRMMSELERSINAMRKDPWGELPGAIGRTVFVITNEDRFEHNVRGYYARELQVEARTRWATIEES